MMKTIMAAYLKRIKWDRAGIPIRLFPFTRERYAESPEIVSIDPKIRFGRPCIAGTRIPTAIISERHQAGDSIDLLAKDYGRNAEEIEEAIRYEGRAERDRRRHRPGISRQGLRREPTGLDRPGHPFHRRLRSGRIVTGRSVRQQVRIGYAGKR
jgi:uncharacterized protein (DUF433 family)